MTINNAGAVQVAVDLRFAPDNTTVMKRESVGFQLKPNPNAGRNFESWKQEVDTDLDHSFVLRQTLRKVVLAESLPTAVMFERIQLKGCGESFTKILPTIGSNADVWDRRPVVMDDGQKAFDYVRRGHPHVRLIGQGQLA